MLVCVLLPEVASWRVSAGIPSCPPARPLLLRRDTEHGIGPKRLGTICSLVLQRSLLQWLDDCQRELAREAAAKQLEAVVGAMPPAAVSAPARPATAVLLPPLSPARPSPDAASPPATAGASLGGEAAACPSIPEAAAVAQQAGTATAQEPAQPASPFAPLAGVPPSLSPRASPAPHHRPSASAPATPADARSGSLAAAAVPASEGAVLALAAAPAAAGEAADGAGPSDSMQRMASLHGYMGMLSLKRPQVCGRAQASWAAWLPARRCMCEFGMPAAGPGFSSLAPFLRTKRLPPPLHSISAVCTVAGCAARHAGSQRAASGHAHQHDPPAVWHRHAAGAQQQQQRPRGGSGRHGAVGAGALPDRPVRAGGPGSSTSSLGCVGCSRCRQPTSQPA